MPNSRPYVRDVGSGPGVVCIHSNASTSSQWRTLMDRLAPGHHVFAPDSLGAGRSPPWPAERVVMLGDEVALLEVPVLYMVGSKSPASSRGVARLLTGVLPDVAVVELAGLGHMGPVTHPEVVNDRIADFLAAH